MKSTFRTSGAVAITGEEAFIERAEMEVVENTITRQLTEAMAACLDAIEKFREGVIANCVTRPVPDVSVTRYLNLNSAAMIAAEFSYHEYRKTLHQIGHEKCSLVESLEKTRASLEHALIEQQWSGGSTSDFHNAVESVTAATASQLVRQFKRWSDLLVTDNG